MRRESSWEWQEIVEVINPALDMFLDAVSTELLGSRWEQFKQESRNGEKKFLPLPPYREGGVWEKVLTSFYGVPTQIEPDWYPDD